jgi:hypothetical protein
MVEPHLASSKLRLEVGDHLSGEVVIVLVGFKSRCSTNKVSNSLLKPSKAIWQRNREGQVSVSREGCCNESSAQVRCEGNAAIVRYILQRIPQDGRYLDGILRLNDGTIYIVRYNPSSFDVFSLEVNVGNGTAHISGEPDQHPKDWLYFRKTGSCLVKQLSMQIVLLRSKRTRSILCVIPQKFSLPEPVNVSEQLDLFVSDFGHRCYHRSSPFFQVSCATVGGQV